MAVLIRMWLPKGDRRGGPKSLVRVLEVVYAVGLLGMALLLLTAAVGLLWHEPLGALALFGLTGIIGLASYLLARRVGAQRFPFLGPVRAP